MRWALPIAGAVLVGGGIVLALITQTGPSADESAQDEIRTLLDQQRAAYLARDLDGYLATIDPGRVFLRSCEEQRFAALARLGIPPPPLRLGKTDKYLDYLRGWVDFGDGWQRMFFRNDGARWYMSEPTSGELGEERAWKYGGVVVTYREVESDLVDVVAKDLQYVIDSVVAQAPSKPAQLFALRIATLTSTDGRCFVAGEAGGYGRTQITLREIRVTGKYDQLSVGSEATFRHEAMHWIQAEHSFNALVRADWWLVEGWPSLIANTPFPAERTRAVCRGTPPTFNELRLGPGPATPIETTATYYTVAALLVERLSEKDVAPGGYWSLFDAFAGTADSSPYQSALGVDGPRFYSSWLQAAQKSYC